MMHSNNHSKLKLRLAVLLLVAAFIVLAIPSIHAQSAGSCNVNQTFSYSYYNPNSQQDNVRLTLINSTEKGVDFSFRPGVFFFVYGGTNKTITITASSNHTASGTAWVQVSKNGNPIALLDVPFSLSCEKQPQTKAAGGISALRILEYIGIAILALIVIAAVIFLVIWLLGKNNGGRRDTRRGNVKKASGRAERKANGKVKAEKELPKKKPTKKVDVDEILKKYELGEGQPWGLFQWIMLALFIIFIIAIIIIAISNLHPGLINITGTGAGNITNLSNATH